MPRKQTPFASLVDRSDVSGCWLWTGFLSSEGYGSYGYRGRQQKAHRVAWQLVHGEIPVGMCVCHRCDNPSCVRTEHLFLGTVADNNRDRALKGRSRGTFQTGSAHPATQRRGEKHWQAKLSDEQVRAIRDRSGEQQNILASEFGVHPSTISRITRREWRKEVP